MRVSILVPNPKIIRTSGVGMGTFGVQESHNIQRLLTVYTQEDSTQWQDR